MITAAAPSATFTAAVRQLGLASSVLVAALLAVYASVLVFGLLALDSPADAIGGVTLAVLEGLILLVAPAMVVLMGAVHAWAPTSAKAFTVLAVVFTCALAVVTCSVHAVILTVGSDPGFGSAPLAPRLTSFQWPSVVYALDILAWDVFFPLAMGFAALAFPRGGWTGAVRIAMRVSAGLALAGLAGVALADMSVRNVGIVGYVGGSFVVAALLGAVFFRSPTAPA